MNETNFYPVALNSLIRRLQKLPGIGKRSAERLAFTLLNWQEEELKQFGNELSELKSKINFCQRCANLSDDKFCRFCLSPQREQKTICIIEQVSQISVIENSASFHGLYHILGGKLSPLEGKHPDSLNIQSLHKRVVEDKVEELIIATSPDVEGEATASFLAEEFAKYQIKITRIAAGVPVGSDLSFADSATMARAFSGRRNME